MRKIEEAMCRAIRTKQSMRLDNTAVVSSPNVNTLVYLHGHLIAEISDAMLVWTLAGWNTPTTRSRINAICRSCGGIGVHVKAGIAYHGDRAITSTEWVGE